MRWSAICSALPNCRRALEVAAQRLCGCRCVGKLCEAAIELRNFRSSGRLRALLAEVNTLEEQADDAYATAIHDLFAEDAAPRTLIAGKAIFDCMEACCDLCGHAADVMDQIIIKNT